MGAATGENLDGFLNLKCVANLKPERGRHVGEHGRSFDSGIVSELNQNGGQFASAVDVLHERTRTNLDVEHKRAGALGNLLAHDRRCNKRNRLNGSGHVAKCIELFVGWGEARTCGTNDRTDRLELRVHLGVG